MMDVLVCAAPGELVLERRPMPAPGPDEVLLRVRRVGVCGTDMHIYRGTQPYLSYPRVMGHELSGEVVAAPAGGGLAPGDHAYVMPYLSCGSCPACAKGKTNCCMNIRVLGVHIDGGLAEYLAVPQGFVRKVQGVGLDEAAMVEFLAIGAHAVRRARIEPGQSALVVGAGPIGIAAALFARLAGARVTVLDGREDRLAFCAEHLGVEQAVSLSDRTAESLSELTDGAFYDVVFDATGNPAAMEQGFAYVGHGGSYVLISVVAADITFSDPEFHKREMSLLGSRNATIEDFEHVLAAIRAGLVPTAALNSHKAELRDLAQALPGWMEPAAGVIKAIVAC
ncbi:zinc-binding alcohol dehydrogenase family protein [Caulobacter endophyticus]|uniref:zinc-binding alcohol dehydrogenase family protein n=1 Tax=Caulobacter endophyticus TaxID=2172652 RepID=UPI002410054A|nr:zinc-binding alcohol dehydrogenase family protein [Caulobacter endophyticus]MDG2531049.1 zinc-binding alcohol dehydrogenase family protein [Caulobacter endophyticus]